MPWPRTYEGRPLWGRVEYTALHGARLSSVPSGDQSANPAMFQGTAVSSEHFSQFLLPGKGSGAERLAAPLGISRVARVAGPPLQGTELAALSTPEASLESLDYFSVWKLLPNVSRWVMHTAKQGYRGTLPPPFNGVIPTLVGPEQALVMEQEVSTPEEGGHRGGPSSRQRVRVLQPYFIVPGKDGGLRPILNLS